MTIRHGVSFSIEGEAFTSRGPKSEQSVRLKISKKMKKSRREGDAATQRSL